MKIIEDPNTMPDKAREIFCSSCKDIEKILAPLRIMFPEIPFKSVIRIHTENETAYENDGNTQCPGTRYSFWWMIPIGRELDLEHRDIHDEWQSWYHGNGNCAMYFNINFNLRNYDNKINFNPTLFLSVCPMILDTRKRSNNNRIEPYVSELTLTQIGMFVKQIKQEQEMFALAKNAIKMENQDD